MTEAGLYIAGGLLLLLVGGEWLVRGAVGMAKRLQVPTMLIGLTVVAYGTSAPELVVSLHATLSGHPDVAMGNVIGSNISNILLVLGVSACLAPLPVSKRLLRRDGMFLVLASVVFTGVALSGTISRAAGALLLTLLVLYTLYIMRNTKNAPEGAQTDGISLQTPHSDEDDIAEEIAAVHDPLWLTWVISIAGLGALTLGAHLLVDGASNVARLFGVSEAVIGVTIVAIGTSLPELMTSVIAACRKHTGLAIANVIGSNTLNIMGVIGPAAIITPIAVHPQFQQFDLGVMLLVTCAALALAARNRCIGRFAGSSMALGFAAYLYAQYYFTYLH